MLPCRITRRTQTSCHYNAAVIPATGEFNVYSSAPVPEFGLIVLLSALAFAFPDPRCYLWYSDVCIDVYGELQRNTP